MRKHLFVLGLLALLSFAVAAQDYPIGGWADEFVFFFENDQSKVLDMMQSGDAHFFGNNFDSERQADILASGLPFDVSYGSYNEYMYNPVPGFNDGRTNPFGSGKLRQAIHWLIDRDFIIDEYLFGLGIPYVGLFNPNFPTAGAIGPTLRKLAIQFAPDEARALQVIEEEMLGMGFEKVNGVWAENGEPHEIIILIRTEDERLQLGDYLADRLELAGFAVDRHYGLNAELQAFWVSSDPNEGLWHVYTAGWIANTIDRSENSQHIFFDTPDGYGLPLWQNYTPPAEYYQLTQDFYYGNFTSLEERVAMAEQLELWSTGDEVSYHTFIYVQAGTWAWANNVTTTVGTCSGVMANPFMARVARFVDEDGAPVVGGTVLVADPGMFVEPWNPVDGSNWLYDSQIYNQTEDRVAYPDPYTGLYFPWQIDHAQVWKNSDVIMFQEKDWVTLDIDDNIVPPADALYDWDAENQRWITIGEAFPDGTTAKTKVTITFVDDLYENKWHDGSQLSFADFYYKYIMGSARPKEASPYYDASTVAAYNTGLATTRGLVIDSVDPLVITFYDDQGFFDAEEHAFQFANSFCPRWNYGIAPWHVMAAALRGEQAQKYAFSADKAVALGVDRVSFIAGPTLELLKVDAQEAATENFIPWVDELGKYMDLDEPFERYQNMVAYLEEWGHLWIGLGPYQIEEVDTVAQQIVIRKFPDYRYTNEAFMNFATPKYADISVTGSDIVAAGDAVTFDVNLSYQGEAYPAAEIKSVAWLIVDASGAVAADGAAELSGDGLAVVTLGADVTAGLAEGSTTLEVVAVLTPVAKPSYGSYSFLITQ